MRDPRPGLAWSGQRLALRSRYNAYMQSGDWYRRRERWLVEYRAANDGRDPTCAICNDQWSLQLGDLHHRTYSHLGYEDWRELLPICRRDHLLLHALMEHNPGWRRLSREQATDMIVARLRADKESDIG